MLKQAHTKAGCAKLSQTEHDSLVTTAKKKIQRACDPPPPSGKARGRIPYVSDAQLIDICSERDIA